MPVAFFLCPGHHAAPEGENTSAPGFSRCVVVKSHRVILFQGGSIVLFVQSYSSLCSFTHKGGSILRNRSRLRLKSWLLTKCNVIFFFLILIFGVTPNNADFCILQIYRCIQLVYLEFSECTLR